MIETDFRLILGQVRADFRPERADFNSRPVRTDFSQVRADFRPERADFTRIHFRLESVISGFRGLNAVLSSLFSGLVRLISSLILRISDLRGRILGSRD